MQTPERDPIQGRTVQLMISCLCDAFFDDAAQATVEVLQQSGCQVSVPSGQTCCGQAAYTAGDWEACRRVMRHTAKVFPGPAPVVVASGSCAAALFHEAPIAFEGEPDLAVMQDLSRRTWELTDFLTNALGVDRWPGHLEARAVIHHGCHTRGTATRDSVRTLCGSIDGLEILEFPDADQCCGFGGVFSVSHPYISTEMGRKKVADVLSVEPEFVISADMSCLMHQQGIAKRLGSEYRTRYIAQVMRDASMGRAK
jgi:L-lactate dehydrogenase complex protein LldE